MYILGINAYHGGASACLIKSGQLIAAAEEERFTRIKYWAGFPVQAIRYCLEEAGITPQDLDHIALARDPGANVLQKVLYSLRRRPNFDFIQDRLKQMGKTKNLQAIFFSEMHISPDSLKHTEFHNIEHHHAHMGAAFLVSPYDQAAVLSIDGMGDFVSTMWSTGSGTSFDVHGEINFPHSLGYFYTAISQWLGFPKYGDEGKVMGLAPYGEPIFIDKMRDIVRVQRDGTFELNLDYFTIHTDGISMSWDGGEPSIGTMYSDKLLKALGPAREPRTELTKTHQDVAASLQAMLEEAEFALVNKLQKDTGQKALCMAGGVALNSAFNGKILPHTAFEDIFIQPAAGDAGNALGAAYYVYHVLLGQPRNFVMDNSYTGPHYTNDTIEAKLKAADVSYTYLDDQALLSQTAKLVAQGNVVGWFQGRMEWGPRALGNRSIIADPRRTDMKDILNARIKHREPFRPFAPSVLQEEVGQYFDQSYPDPFMIKVYNVLSEKQSVIPAVTHVDGTGRLQTVSRDQNPRYWGLINAFCEETGVPVILNTSFNENEPIVCNPKQAIDCFQRTHMDALVIGNYLAKK